MENHIPFVGILDPQFIGTDYNPNIEQTVLEGVAIVKCFNATKVEEIPDSVSECSAILAWHHITHIDHSLLLKMKKCKVIVRIGMGYDNIDTKAATELGIKVCNVPDYGVEEVADSTICMLLNLMRRTFWLGIGTKDGNWATKESFGATRLLGRTLGIIGLGRIGMAVALRAKAFSLNVIFFDPYIEHGRGKSLGLNQIYSLNELLSNSDIISVHCPLIHKNKSNFHLLNSENMKLIKNGSFLINTARGPIIQEEALVECLKDGRLASAAIDVYEKEPYTKGPLLELSNVLLTPHCAFYSDQGLIEMRSKAALEAKRVITGQETWYCVNETIQN